MKANIIRTRDRIHARTLELRTRAAVAAPVLGRLVGAGDNQRVWHFASQTDPQSLPWFRFDCLSRHPGVTALLGVRADEGRVMRDDVMGTLSERQRNTAMTVGARTLGNAVMATEIKIPDEGDADHTVVGFDIYQGEHRVNLGIYVQADRLFVPFQDQDAGTTHSSIASASPRYYPDLPSLYPGSLIQRLQL